MGKTSRLPNCFHANVSTSATAKQTRQDQVKVWQKRELPSGHTWSFSRWASASLGIEQLLCVKGRGVNNVDGVAPSWGGRLNSLRVCMDAKKQALDRMYRQLCCC